MSAIKIVVVEDEEIIRLGNVLHLKSFGYDVVGDFSSGKEAIEKIVELKPDIVLMDVELTGSHNGIETAKQIKEKVDVPIIYLSVYSDLDTIKKAESTKPFRYMTKPFDDEELKFTIETAIETHKMKERLSKEIEEYKGVFFNIQGIIYRIYTKDKKTKFFNDMFEEITGFKCSELEYDRVHFILPLILKEDREKFINKWSRSIEFKKPSKMNYRIKNKNGEIRHLQEMNKPVVGDNGQIIYTDGTIFDINMENGKLSK